MPGKQDTGQRLTSTGPEARYTEQLGNELALMAAAIHRCATGTGKLKHLTDEYREELVTMARQILGYGNRLDQIAEQVDKSEAKAREKRSKE